MVGGPRLGGGGRRDDAVRVEVEVEPSTVTMFGAGTGDWKGESRT
jgi:hypothetical protein